MPNETDLPECHYTVFITACIAIVCELERMARGEDSYGTVVPVTPETRLIWASAANVIEDYIVYGKPLPPKQPLN